MATERHRREKRDPEWERGEQISAFSTRTNSKDPNLINSRVFIGNLPTDKVDRKVLLNVFEKYGTVLGVSVLNGYGFVQFEHADDAREAVENEQGGLLKGSKMDVKMAAEGKKMQQEQNQKRALASARGGRGAQLPRRDDRDRERERSRSPVYGRRPMPHLDDRRGLRRPLPPRDIYGRKDPFDSRDRYGRPPSPYYGPLPPPMPANIFRPPYECDILPSPRDRYARPHSPYYVPPPLPPPVPADNIFRPPYECEIILTSPTLRAYADSIESELKPHGMVVQHNVLKLESDIPKAVEELTRLKVPYAIIIGQKNEVHRSITLNILHGTPQEHRNMPLEDALKLIIRTFEAYVQEIRDKAAAPAVRPDFLPPDEHTTYLVNLLADNRILNVDEINHIIGYLEKRRKVLTDSKRPTVAAVPDRAGLMPSDGEELSTSPAAAASVPSTALINFSNPSVQKALDDLMQTSGPSGLLPGASGDTGGYLADDYIEGSRF